MAHESQLGQQELERPNGDPGDVLLAPAVTKRLIKESARGPAVGLGELDVLTRRENEIMARAARRLSNGEIAERCHLSETTVKTHVNRPMNKLEPSSRAQVVAATYEAGPRDAVAVHPIEVLLRKLRTFLFGFRITGHQRGSIASKPV